MFSWWTWRNTWPETDASERELLCRSASGLSQPFFSGSLKRADALREKQKPTDDDKSRHDAANECADPEISLSQSGKQHQTIKQGEEEQNATDRGPHAGYAVIGKRHK